MLMLDKNAEGYEDKYGVYDYGVRNKEVKGIVEFFCKGIHSSRKGQVTMSITFLVYGTSSRLLFGKDKPRELFERCKILT